MYFFTVFAVTIFCGDIFVARLGTTVGEHAANSTHSKDKEFHFDAGSCVPEKRYLWSNETEKRRGSRKKMALFLHETIAVSYNSLHFVG